jgi:hypothetical protein
MTHDKQVRKAIEDIAAEVGVSFPGAGLTGAYNVISRLIREAEQRGAIEAAEGAEIEGETEHLSED